MTAVLRGVLYKSILKRKVFDFVFDVWLLG